MHVHAGFVAHIGFAVPIFSPSLRAFRKSNAKGRLRLYPNKLRLRNRAIRIVIDRPGILYLKGASLTSVIVRPASVTALIVAHPVVFPSCRLGSVRNRNVNDLLVLQHQRGEATR